MKKNVQFFCDFDGTIARNDVGEKLFLRFGAAETCYAAVREWMRGEISSTEMYRRECETARVSRKELAAFASGQKLDPHFKGFIDACRNHGYEVMILSDGFKTYIDLILAHAGLTGLPVYSNDIEFFATDRIRPVFPYEAGSCGKCANCKGYQIRRHRQEGSTIVYVGDGYSDRCGALEADIIFAKKDLLNYCRQEQIDCFAYTTFADVYKKCQKIGLFD